MSHIYGYTHRPVYGKISNRKHLLGLVRMKNLWARNFAVVLLTASCIPALAKDADKKAPSTARGSSAWVPETVKGDLTRFAPGYQGVNGVRFYELFKSRTERLSKGEYETSEAYAKRTADTDALLAPISTTADYAFKLASVDIKYDADREAYSLGGKLMHPCAEPTGYGKGSGWITCDVATVFHKSDKYSASNAYGASRTVDRTRSTRFGVAIRKDHPVFSNSLVRQYGAFNGYDFAGQISVPIEKAKQIRDGIGVMFVGNITGPFLVDGHATLIEPTISSPIDLFVMTKAVPFELKKIMFYVIATGEILEERQN